MKNLYILNFNLLIFSCNTTENEVFKSEITGIWQDGEQILLIQDSIMINPFWNSPGFFPYSIKNDTLVIQDPNTNENSGKLKFLNPNEFHLIAFNQENDTLKFKRMIHNNSRTFESIIFEAGFDEGRMPVFNMEIDQTGKVAYVGKHYTELKGQYQIQLDSVTINQLNQLFEIIDIWNYPKEELLPVAGNANLNLTVEYPEGNTILIEDGLFEGKYYVILKVFHRFESLLLRKKAHNITLDPAGGTE